MAKCPRCGVNDLDPVEVRNALSRPDNKTYICSACGTEEALVDAGLAEERKWVQPIEEAA